MLHWPGRRDIRVANPGMARPLYRSHLPVSQTSMRLRDLQEGVARGQGRYNHRHPCLLRAARTGIWPVASLESSAEDRAWWSAEFARLAVEREKLRVKAHRRRQPWAKAPERRCQPIVHG